MTVTGTGAVVVFDRVRHNMYSNASRDRLRIASSLVAALEPITFLEIRVVAATG